MSITPLVDVVFLLLLFFALTLHFSPEEAIFVELPTSSSAKQQSETEIILTVTPEGVIRLNGKDVPHNFWKRNSPACGRLMKNKPYRYAQIKR